MGKDNLIRRHSSVGLSALNPVNILSKRACVLALVVAGLVANPAVHAQVPAILWRTNVGANFLSEDGQTNVYLNAGITIVTLNSAGIPVQTNLFNQSNSVAQRDAGGNYYFAGIRLAAISGSGVDYGTTNACFLTKYTGGGVLVWSNGFGPTGFLKNITLTDLQVDTNGNAYAGYVYNTSISGFSAMVAKLDSTGATLWNLAMPKASTSSTVGATRLTVLSPTNGLALTYASTLAGPGPCDVFLSGFDNNGNATVVTNWSSNSSLTPALARDSAGNFYTRETNGLAKRGPSGAIVWQISVATSLGPVGADPSGGVYGSDPGSGANTFSRYDAYGNLVWSTNFPGPPLYWSYPVSQVFVDPSGNRFISFADGSIARMVADAPPAAPSITTPPQSTTVFVGDNVGFNEMVSGTQPMWYWWQLDGTNLPNATNAVLSLNGVTTAQAGVYTVVVSNVVGVITSTPPAVLRVKSVELYYGSQLLTNGTYAFSSPPTLSIRSAFTNGEEFYTLNGSAPDFTSKPYSAPFTAGFGSIVRAIGYSSDFSKSEEADQVNIVQLVNHTLRAMTAGGGTINLNPPGGTYASTNIVTVSAVPNSGWQFLYWLGDATGSNSPVQLTMDNDKTVVAVFGTTLSTSVAGNGQVLLDPAGGLYPYGTTVRLTGVPQAGSFFGAWGNAASGSANPLYFTVTNPAPTVSSIFGTTSGSQAALTVEISGRGQVNVSPQGNVFSTGQMVTLTAIPDAGQSFLSWGGDAAGTQTNLGVTLDQSKVITATFTRAPVLSVDTQIGEGLGPEGFRFGLEGDSSSIYQLFWSTNLEQWQSWGYVTNQYGEAEILDTGATNSSQKFYRVEP